MVAGDQDRGLRGDREIVEMMGAVRIVSGMLLATMVASASFAVPPGRPGERPRRGRSPGQSTQHVKIGQPSTDFELPVLIERTDDKGEKVAVVTTEKVKLSDYRGKKVVCVFMSSYT